MITNITQVLNLIHQGRIVEIRAIGVPTSSGGKKAIWSGYFNNYSKATEAAQECEAAKATGIYMTLNEVHPGVFARSPNLLDKHPLHTTTDNEVLQHRWMLIDVDPVRPSGISSTDAELAIAKDVRDDVAAFLHEQYPHHTMVLAASGNGYHALLQIALTPADQRNIVVTLSRLFGDPRVEIDKSVNKPAQLTKLYGTTARKGYSIADRPHRMSGIEKIIKGQPNGHATVETQFASVSPRPSGNFDHPN